ncbi:MAG: ABC transporter permease [Clostridia bacterium]|nr:ABC transporter permease [Clostridia bacterium]
MIAIFKREFKSYFISMTGYVFLAVMLVFAGIYTMAINLLQLSPSFEYVLSNMTIVLMIVVPILTMRTLAEERRSRTDQLLYALPMKLSSVVMGKYLAAVAVYGLCCGIFCLYPLVLSLFGEVYMLGAYSAIFGFFLLGSALIAICVFLSSLTESQSISAVLGVAVLLAIYLLSSLVELLPATALGSLLCFLALIAALTAIVYVLTKNLIICGVTLVICAAPTLITYFVNSTLFEGLFPKLVEYIAVFDRFYSFADGIFDLTAIVYFISIAVFFVFLTVQAMEKRRWS